jgi:kynurenine formamidase
MTTDDQGQYSLTRSLAERLSNAGRWGHDDERGTLNFITAAHVLRAVGLVRSGRVVSVSHDIGFDVTPQNPFPGQHRMMFRPAHAMIASDSVTIECHGLSMTHVDALSHMALDDQTYNNRSFSEIWKRDGLSFGSILPIADGIVTRGVLLDIAASRGCNWLERGDGVSVSDLEAAATLAGVEVCEGDALVVRVGLEAREAAMGIGSPDLRTGLLSECIEWLHDRSIAVFGGDCIERFPSDDPTCPTPLHAVALRAMGLVLIDNIAVEELSAVCHEESRYEFMFVAAPLRIPRGTGSPVNPLCLF